MDSEGQSFEWQIKIANNSLYDLSSQLLQIQKLSNRSKYPVLAQRIASMGGQIERTTNLVQAITDWPDRELNSGEQLLKRDLMREYDLLIHKVKEAQLSITERLKKQFKQQPKGSPGGLNESTPLLSEGSGSDTTERDYRQQQILDHLDQTELDLNTSIIEERDAEIGEIQRGAREINAIFQDLGVILSEQGQQLDSVEDNITYLARQTNQAGQQLVKAESYQRSKGKWSCIALFVLLVITVLIAVSVLS